MERCCVAKVQHAERYGQRPAVAARLSCLPLLSKRLKPLVSKLPLEPACSPHTVEITPFLDRHTRVTNNIRSLPRHHHNMASQPDPRYAACLQRYLRLIQSCGRKASYETTVAALEDAFSRPRTASPPSHREDNEWEDEIRWNLYHLQHQADTIVLRYRSLPYPRSLPEAQVSTLISLNPQHH